MNRQVSDVGMVDGRWGIAGSGILFTTGPRILLLQRSMRVLEPGTWGIPGGAIPVDRAGELDDALQSALREAREEIGRVPRHQIVGKYVYQDGSFVFTTFIALVEREFRPRLNEEHDAYRWWDPEVGPRVRLHPGVKALLRHLRDG